MCSFCCWNPHRNTVLSNGNRSRWPIVGQIGLLIVGSSYGPLIPSLWISWLKLCKTVKDGSITRKESDNPSYRLYRRLASSPMTNALDRSIAFVRQAHSVYTPLFVEVHALWDAVFLLGKIPILSTSGATVISSMELIYITQGPKLACSIYDELFVGNYKAVSARYLLTFCKLVCWCTSTRNRSCDKSQE